MAATSQKATVRLAGSDTAARTAMVTALAFLLLAGGLTWLASVKLAFPTALADVAFFSYGRLAPMAMAAMVFGFVTFANFAAIYYLLPRLTGAKLALEPIAVAGLAASAVVTLIGIFAIGFGQTDGRLFAEMPWVTDLLLGVTYLVPLAVTLRTVADRTESSMYVSLWYILGGVIWLPGLVLAGNIGGNTGTGAALQGAFYSAGLVGLWSMGIGIGAVYYVIPKATGKPLFSRQLALAGFWSLAFVQLWTGSASMVAGPASDWVESIGIVFTLAMVIPPLAVLVNYVATLDGAWDMVRDRSELQFGIAAAVATLFLALVAGGQSFRSASAVLGLTIFGSGTRYALLHGAAFLYAASFLTHAIPRSFGRSLFSEAHSRLSLRLVTIGVALTATLTWLSGLTAGYGSLAGAYTGEALNVGDTFGAASGSGNYTLIALTGLVTLAGQTFFALTMYRTIASGAATGQEILTEVNR